LAAVCHQTLHLNGWGEDPERERQQSVDFARRAFRVAGDDPYALGDTAFVIGYFERDINLAIVLIDRSLELNPSFAIGWLRSGWIRLWSGQTDLYHAFHRLRKSLEAPASMGIGVGTSSPPPQESGEMLLLSWKKIKLGTCYRFRFMLCAFRAPRRYEKPRQAAAGITPIVIPSAAHWRIQSSEFFLGPAQPDDAN
jgi:adenylate cyclase